ncbi:alcohol dehydrogenase catalytic domain-containing protein [Maliponia aquimaris]|uniref:Putative L-galactonate oxidoreductase n=1 Tax=Maliponia aquimaris TaxID=1673631 RepID=A0A238JZ06_9RHOB|nr:alcohol dehydrogenase catalytic domain-containing protein [Maliponia aquimaris]SMX35888.1 Putative L-galactonate oxidoreductase [Maliponia aquimaris]
MKALVYTDPEHMEIREVPDPVPGTGERLVTVDSAGICGSDMHAYLGHDNRRPAPLILGHEASGTLEDGRRVTLNPLVTCGTCPACTTGRDNLCPTRQILSMQPREGAFAQAVVIPERNLVTVPEGFALDKAALAEPLSVSWHSARLGLAAMHPADARRALVIGGGAIGLAAALALKAMGAEDVVIAEPNATRRAYLADRCGIDARETAQGAWPLVIDAVGYAATRQVASGLVTPGGVIVHIGLGEDTGGLDVRRMTLQEITFIGTYTYTAQDFRDCAAAMFEGRLGPLDWTETRPLSEGARAFADIRAGRVAAPKIILKPDA